MKICEKSLKLRPRGFLNAVKEFRSFLYQLIKEQELYSVKKQSRFFLISVGMDAE